MRLTSAPMQGVTDRDFRQVHSKFFTPADAYYTPFLSPTATHRLTPKELREVLPENNVGVTLVPQLLCASAPDFVWAAGELAAMGYGEVNLNLGCPSGTVTAKKKGSGMLEDTELLRKFLDGIFEGSAVRISIKTRIGSSSADEFSRLAEIFNDYPIKELCIHCRVRTQQYKGAPDLSAWETALRVCRAPLCYNGDIFDAPSAERLLSAYPETQAIMLGRGLAANPALIGEINGGAALLAERLRSFHDELFALCKERIGCEKPLLLHMKELWTYLGCSFEDAPKPLKAIKKSQTVSDYLSAVSTIFTHPVRTNAGFIN